MQSGVRSKSLRFGTFLFPALLLAGTTVVAAQTTEPALQQPAKQEQKPEPTQPDATPSQAAPAPAYKPKFTGDPAHSDAEASTLGYIRTVLTAQKLYKKKHGTYATALPGLVNTGSFTRRMTKTDRGDYNVAFHSQGGGFRLTLTPNQFDAAHRAFYSDETGVIRAETDKPATADSDRLH